MSTTHPATERALGKGLEGLGPGRIVLFRVANGIDLPAIVLATVRSQQEPSERAEVQARYFEGIPHELLLDPEHPGTVHLCVFDWQQLDRDPVILRTAIPMAGETIEPETWRWPPRM